MPDVVKRRPYDSPRRRDQAATTRSVIMTAAQRLFERHGYAATSVPVIAAEARVAVKTVYLAFDTKAGLLRALWAARLSPGEEDKPVLERAWYGTLVAEQDPKAKLRLLAQQSRRVKARSGDLMEVIRAAAPGDSDVSQLWDGIQRKLLEVQRAVVTELEQAGALKPGLDLATATDLLWTLNHPSVWHLLVRGRGWTNEQYEAWIFQAFCGQLLSDP